jgi:hypothetical protein
MIHQADRNMMNMANLLTFIRNKEIMRSNLGTDESFVLSTIFSAYCIQAEHLIYNHYPTEKDNHHGFF